MKNWKTSTLGILTIIGTLATAGIGFLQGDHVNLTVVFAGVSTGWGLIMAADAKPAGSLAVMPKQDDTTK